MGIAVLILLALMIAFVVFCAFQLIRLGTEERKWEHGSNGTLAFVGAAFTLVSAGALAGWIGSNVGVFLQ